VVAEGGSLTKLPAAPLPLLLLLLLPTQFQNLHEGSVSCLEGTHSGRLLFSGGADGLLMAHDLRMKVRMCSAACSVCSGVFSCLWLPSPL
jgi:hypothetical protein